MAQMMSRILRKIWEKCFGINFEVYAPHEHGYKPSIVVFLKVR